MWSPHTELAAQAGPGRVPLSLDPPSCRGGIGPWLPSPTAPLLLPLRDLLIHHTQINLLKQSST